MLLDNIEVYKEPQLASFATRLKIKPGDRIHWMVATRLVEAHGLPDWNPAIAGLPASGHRSRYFFGDW